MTINLRTLSRLLFIPIAFMLIGLANCGESSDEPKKDDPTEEPPTTITYTVVNSGTSAYSFSGNGLTNALNPSLTLTKGVTYTFNISASGHPFWIKTVQGSGTGNAYSSGVTDNGSQSGSITFTVPSDAPATLFYNCQFHGVMTGTITIVAP